MRNRYRKFGEAKHYRFRVIRHPNTGRLVPALYTRDADLVAVERAARQPEDRPWWARWL
ncbi:MAG: hypothetical protein QM612_09105 [Thermomonas sp.]|uniref:hypothetical protein n=1 Tax=Thermomonas sp. TaxID=1971895 RepID=UPI0039E24567